MRGFRRRLVACALAVVSSFVVAEAQQQQRQGRSPDRSRVDLAAAAGGVVTSVDSDGVPKFVWATGARPAPAGSTDDGAARWHLRQFARALLGGRRAFVGRNAAFPARETLSLNLGTAFAGQTVRIRFRIATDAGAGDVGWEIDNLAFQGITNLPFSAFVEDRSRCGGGSKR